MLRHAKSDWVQGAEDHERPLNERGFASSSVVGHFLKSATIEPDVVLCSSARRAQQTLEGIRFSLPEDTKILIEHDLYLASVTELLTRLRTLDDGTDSVMLIGHNPGVQDLIGRLANDGELLEEVATKYPTAALATMTFEGTWNELEPASARLTAFVTPKDLAR